MTLHDAGISRRIRKYLSSIDARIPIEVNNTTMSENEKINDGNKEGESLDSDHQEVTNNSAESPKSEKSSQPSPNKTSILYGTRKRRPGAQTPSAAKTLDQIRGAYDDEDIIEMDDLPTRSSAPATLIENDHAPERKRRERRARIEEPAKSDASSEEEVATPVSEIAAYPTDEDASDDSTESSRPRRFAEVDESKRAGTRQIEEFSPSKDGKRSAPKKRVPSEDRISAGPVPNEKRGFFAWLKSLFSSEPDQPQKRRKGRPNNRRPNQKRRGGQNRRRSDGPQREGSGGGQEGRRPRRNRRPRGEGGNSEGNRQGGNRQRRRRRPQGERKRTPSE